DFLSTVLHEVQHAVLYLEGIPEMEQYPWSRDNMRNALYDRLNRLHKSAEAGALSPKGQVQYEEIKDMVNKWQSLSVEQQQAFLQKHRDIFYKNDPIEVEAFETQNRIDFTPAQRRATPIRTPQKIPWSTIAKLLMLL